MLTACANPKAPSGGEKDVIPPKLLKTSPENFSTNIKENTFVFEFDENIKDNNIKKNLIISPKTENDYKHNIKKKTLTLSFEKPFEENTTYSFFFGNSIQDITEGNKTQEMNYVFSTGDYLDSLECEVNLKYPLTQKGCSGYVVGLYAENDSIYFKKITPIYYSKSDVSGKVVIKNIKSGIYKLFAFKDENEDLSFDEKEKYAFSDSLITINKNTLLNLNVVEKDQRKQSLKNYSSKNQIHEFSLEKGIISYSLLDTNNNELDIKHISYNKTTISVYEKLPSTIKIKTTDSLNNIDTIIIPRTKNDTSSYILSLVTEKLINPNKEVILDFSHPLEKIDTLKITILADSNEADYKIKIFDNKLIIKTKAEKNILINIDSAAVFDLNNKTNKKEFLLIKIKEEENYGKLKGQVICNYKNYWFDLLDANFKTIESYKNSKEFDMNFLDAKTYKIRIRIDLNNNGFWDSGNFTTSEQPEPVFFHNTDLILKQNWEIKNILVTCPVENN